MTPVSPPVPAPALRTAFCELVGVEYPIVQTGMGWVAGVRLTAATSNAGGLGILASTTMTIPQVADAIAELKDRTDKPFGVNVRSNHADVQKVVDLLIKHQVKVASFAQAPNEALIKKLKDGGVICMPTIAAKRHAEKVAGWGVDAVIAQGHEGGGHTGAIPTSLLLPTVTAAVDIPVLGAGGFHDGRGLVAALAWGAAGIAMGTRFLLTQESRVPDVVKAEYLKTPVTGTKVTLAVDGQPQRVISTDLIERLEKGPKVVTMVRALGNALKLRKLTDTGYVDLVKEGMNMRKNHDLTLAQMSMAANAPMLTKAAMVDGHLEAGILPTGQVTGVIEELPTVADLINRIIAEGNATLERLASGTSFAQASASADTSA
jgi:NAD(P)H-dependent flavin oxidoreductase YrpB (nitropropane dioxygenase family)